MKLIAGFFAAALLCMTPVDRAAAFEPDLNSELQLDVARAILNLKERDPGVQKFFDSAAGYAVFPNVGKGGFMIGGAYGKGLVIVNEQVDGYSTVTQFTIGAQIGAQKYSLYLFFKDQVALEYFKRENFEFSAQATAVAVTAGAAANTSYDAGVAVFTIADGGLMAEATLGGQQFSYEPRKY
jgi:lipid-binding SYLF domain-containing protein